MPLLFAIYTLCDCNPHSSTVCNIQSHRIARVLISSKTTMKIAFTFCCLMVLFAAVVVSMAQNDTSKYPRVTPCFSDY
ncbi:hypothetical protein BsWGS_28344 [Bradybaena similaris]